MIRRSISPLESQRLAVILTVLPIQLYHTSRNPLIKLSGNLAVGFSSARKYFRICGNCFQKFSVSCQAQCISTLMYNSNPILLTTPRVQNCPPLFQDPHDHCFRLEATIPDTPLDLEISTYPPRSADQRIDASHTLVVSWFAILTPAC